jgi:LacI family transcriptional regulator
LAQVTSGIPRQAVSAATIAKHCGVSQQAVSYAMNGRGRLAERTRARILTAAEELGYQPSAVARSMRTGKFRAVGLLIGSSTPRFLPTEMVIGMEAALAKRGEHLIFTRIPDEKLLAEGFMPRVLEESSVDGLLIHYTHHFPDQMRELIDRYRIPSIWVNTKLPDDCIYPKEREAARLGTERLIEAGHRRIGFVNLAGGGHFSETDRRTGYEKAMRAAGLTPQVVESGLRMRDVDPNADPRAGLARQVLSPKNRPTAVLCYELTSALPMMFAAAGLGLAVPQDLSLLTFGRGEPNELGRPLSLLKVPMDRLSGRSVEMIQQKIAEPHVRLKAEQVPYAPPTPATITSPPTSRRK